MHVFVQTHVFLGKFQLPRNISPTLNFRLALALFLYSAKLSTCITTPLTEQCLKVSEFLKCYEPQRYKVLDFH